MKGTGIPVVAAAKHLAKQKFRTRWQRVAHVVETRLRARARKVLKISGSGPGGLGLDLGSLERLAEGQSLEIGGTNVTLASLQAKLALVQGVTERSGLGRPSLRWSRSLCLPSHNGSG